MLVDFDNKRQHLPWIVIAGGLGLGLGGWYFASAIGKPDWPGGSSPAGFTLGVVGGLIILFEFLIWPRKKLRTWRIGRVKHWMAAHIWLGLLCLPLLILHSGFYLGGPLSAVLTILLVIVIASGVWGLVLQQSIPKQMLDNIPAETIYSQIDRISRLSRREARKLVVATCGPSDDPTMPDVDPEDDEAESIADEDEQDVGYVTVGAVRSAGRTQGMVLQTRVPTAPVPESEALRVFFHKVALPYLRTGEASGSPLRFKSRAEAVFRDLRTRVAPGAHATVDSLENVCEQRRQHDLQRRLHVWLHNWLLVHLPLSIALVLLMFVHVFFTLKYW